MGKGEEEEDAGIAREMKMADVETGARKVKGDTLREIKKRHRGQPQSGLQGEKRRRIASRARPPLVSNLHRNIVSHTISINVFRTTMNCFPIITN